MKILLTAFTAFIIVGCLSSCLKSNPYYEDFSSTQPIADLPKAPVNAAVATAPTNSWVLMDSVSTTFDYLTSVHLAAKDHVGDVTVRMKIDKAVGQKWITDHPALGYTLLPDSLYTVPSLDVLIKNAGVFSIGDFVVKVRSGVRDPATGTAATPKGISIFKSNKFILPITIEAVTGTPYLVAANYGTILWYMRVK